MRTDIPLKHLTALRSADLLPLFGFPDAEVLKVETLSLPETATELDNVLSLRSPQGQKYLIVLEWQGYLDPAVLWRLVGYLSWLGRRKPDQAIIAVLVYLFPVCDVGNVLTQVVDGRVIQEWKIPCVRLWEQDAPAALASGNLGLSVLSPLMRKADRRLVEQAADLVLTQAPPQQQAELLSILGVFAEPLMNTQHFVHIVGKERLMSSDLLSYLMQEKTAEYEARLAEQLAAKEAELAAKEAAKEAELAAKEAAKEAELAAKEAAKEAELAAKEAAKEAELRKELQQSLLAVLKARFPQAPIALIEDIERIHERDTLRSLLVAAAQASTIEEFAPHLKQAAREAAQQEPLS